MSESQTEMPWFESAEDATHSAIIASKKVIKEVAHALWPSLKIDTAYARLKGALSEDRPEKLSADEHIFIANFCQQYHFLFYSAAQCHHSRPEPVAAEDEAAELQRIIIKGQQELTVALNRYQAIAMRAGGGK